MAFHSDILNARQKKKQKKNSNNNNNNNRILRLFMFNALISKQIWLKVTNNKVLAEEAHKKLS